METATSPSGIFAQHRDNFIDRGEDMTVVTSDKGLKACLDKTAIPYWDAIISILVIFDMKMLPFVRVLIWVEKAEFPF